MPINWNRFVEVIRGHQRFILVSHIRPDCDALGSELGVTAEATGSLVVQAAEALGVNLTLEMATPLFAAVATDTGWYRFPSATAGCYRTAAKLIDAGAQPAVIFSTLYEQDTLGRVKLRG